ncbi:HpcH/HpaI aldolase/citrate lyase family protein [Agromyces sp. Soil535]|uniref:HpcH/HpaI aldolase family protein n=1 Tax=Agromyces sp. Soil535 TaxID=1736390 RepID=UPI0006F4E929|nr:aldolase/citrate lyase family protein [Agromyces sp. Soil535]KRE23368.1 hypothetical protein ASG80_06525 [Agromyces sp. Soil535]
MASTAGEPRLVAELRAGRPQLVLGVRISRSTDVVRIAKSTGHHGIMIDLEHSTMSIDTAATLCATADDLGLTAFARVPENDYGVIGRLLDGGAHGIVVPRVETAAQAELLAGACRFPPRGHRSQTAQLPQLGMVPTRSIELAPVVDRGTIVKVLLESPRGIENAAAIAAVDGIDIVGIGANDLTAELGIPGRYDDPRVKGAAREVASAVASTGKLGMIGGISDTRVLAEYLDMGFAPFLLTGTDSDLLFEGAKTRVERWLGWYDSMSQEA